MKDVLMQDVCEVYLKDLVSGNQYFFGLTTKNGVTQKINQNLLKGGIGNGVRGMVQSDKEIEITVDTLFHNDDLYAIQSGTDFANGTMTVHKSESIICEEAGELEIAGTPKSNSVLVTGADGEPIVGTFATGTFTATTPADIAVGETYSVLYASDATGQALTLDSQKFPKTFALELHTIAYNPETNEVVADVYWLFNKAFSDGALKAQYEAGKVNGDSVVFKAGLVGNSTSYGDYFVVPRA